MTTPNSKPIRKFINLSNVSKHLYCSICSDIFTEPVRLPCGHTFCQECITLWAKKHLECPICRVAFKEKQFQRDLVGYNMVNELEVYCNNKGCPWKSRLENLEEHLKNCNFDPAKIPDFMKSVLYKNAAESNKKKNELGLIEEENESNEHVDFNTKVGLKARLYNKNKKLMERVFSKQKETIKKQPRDSILDLLIS